MLIGNLLITIVAFLIVISVLVIIHEFGHYIVAKKCGVKIEEFSVGFGKEIWGRTDKSGTRWKVCIAPFGGFVKMFGDDTGASNPDLEKLKKLSKKEKEQAFFFKNVYQRIAVVVAGPVFNFVLAILILAGLTMHSGIAHIKPTIDDMVPNSVAEIAGFQRDDHILKINNKKVDDFQDIKSTVAINAGNELTFKIIRNYEVMEIKATPEAKISKDLFGNEVKIGLIGIIAETLEFEKVGPARALTYSVENVYDMSVKTLEALGQMVTGQRSFKDMGGPIKIAKYSGQSMMQGFATFIWFIAIVSANLGLMNLLPIPMLDGGHLVFYTVEAITRKPVPEKIQDVSFKIGFVFIITLMLAATINDIVDVIF